MIRVKVIFTDHRDWTLDSRALSYEQWLTQHLEGVRDIQVERVDIQEVST